VTISAELEFYPHIFSKSEFKVTLRCDCKEDVYAVVDDPESLSSEKPYYLGFYTPSGV